MTSRQALVVAPVGWNRESLAGRRYYDLAFDYVEDYPADGQSAWRIASSPESETVHVAASCRAYTGGYAQHALNRLFSQAVLRCRPSVVVVVGLAGCTADLLRIADLLDVPTIVLLDEPAEPPGSLSEATRSWVSSCLACCEYILPLSEKAYGTWPGDWLGGRPLASIGELGALVASYIVKPRPMYQFDYSLYEFCQRDHPMLVNMQRGDTKHFVGCSMVLDVACGVGVFLDCLRQRGINGQGVERDPRIAKYAMSMGLDITTDDALDFLENTGPRFDGIYCSHFVEHLPIEGVQRLLRLLENRLTEGGVLVMVFPDPESVRSQLLGFWRDPEHIRFYHWELIAAIAATFGLEVEWSSHSEQPHRVVPFAVNPPLVRQSNHLPPFPEEKKLGALSLKEKFLRKLGLVTERRIHQMEQRLLEWSRMLEDQSRDYVIASKQLEERTDSLWDVNQTWAWNDNVTLRLRKRSD